MQENTLIQREGGFSRLTPAAISFALFLITLFAWSAVPANAQHAEGRGAISAQDIARIAKQAATGSDTADQVCARYAAGSVVTTPPELKSQNGVLEVSFKFQTVTDAQGLVRYCYVTDTGLEAPTLRVNPGDTLTIHFQNNLPASSASADGSMAGMNMTLSSSAASASTVSAACNGAMSADATNIHFHGTNVSPVCGQIGRAHV